MEREQQYLLGINKETIRIKITAWVIVSVLVVIVGTLASRQAFPNQTLVTTALMLAAVCAIVVAFQSFRLYQNTQKIDQVIHAMEKPSIALNFNLYIKNSVSEFPILIDGDRLILVDTGKAIILEDVTHVSYRNQRYTGKNQDIFTLTYKDGSKKTFKLLTHPEIQETILKYIKVLNPRVQVEQ
ncbi:hypothetical protein [Erysipelothrix anatis]|uniref:hypothetical protein n=1 Tax=Erysipelothrix anatis TaxID=2683713 RepID=UPI0013574738|nr:hypothetical protein [Erysipelothrix anatis]